MSCGSKGFSYMIHLVMDLLLLLELDAEPLVLGVVEQGLALGELVLLEPVDLGGQPRSELVELGVQGSEPFTLLKIVFGNQLIYPWSFLEINH